MSADRPADLVLTGGRIATMDAARSWAERPGRPRRPDRRRRSGRRRRAAHRARRRGSSPCAVGRSRRASRTPTSTRSTAGWRCSAASSTRTRGPGRALRPHRRLRRGPPRRALDPRRRLVHGRLRGRHAAARGPRRDRPRPAGLPDQSRRPRRVGQHEGARAGRASRPTPPIPPTAASSAIRTARRPARSTKARWTSSRGSMPDDTPADLEEALRLGQRYLHALGITAWQDAIVEPADRGARLRRARRPRRADRRGSSGRCGGSTIAAPSRSRSSSSAARDGHRPLRADERQADDGRRPRELHRRDARALPATATAARPTTAACSQIDPDGLGHLGPGARRARLPAALPRHRRPGRARVARRGRGRASGQRPVGHAPAHRPHPGHPPRRHRALPRRSTWPPTPSRCGPPTRARWTS